LLAKNVTQVAGTCRVGEAARPSNEPAGSHPKEYFYSFSSSSSTHILVVLVLPELHRTTASLSDNFFGSAYRGFFGARSMPSPAGLFAIFIICLLFVAAVAFVVWIGSLPAQIARRRNHPQVDAINAMSWLGLLFGGVGWGLALIWALIRSESGFPVSRKIEIEEDQSAKIEQLESRIAKLEQILTTNMGQGSQA
jgi:hypothetical protein